MAGLKPFDEKSPCSKCGCLRSASVRYDLFGLEGEERLERECQRCGHTWYEACINSDISIVMKPKEDKKS